MGHRIPVAGLGCVAVPVLGLTQLAPPLQQHPEDGHRILVAGLGGLAEGVFCHRQVGAVVGGIADVHPLGRLGLIEADLPHLLGHSSTGLRDVVDEVVQCLEGLG